MKRFVLTLILVSMVLVFSASAEEQERRILVVEGTGDSQVILNKLARRFEQDHPGIRVVVPESVGSGGGIKALLRGRAGLARTARPLKEKERAAGLIQLPFAWSPVVFAAHPAVTSVESISIDQAMAVFQGKILNWQDLGGPTRKLYPVTREEGDSSRTVVDAYLAREKGSGIGLGNAGKVFYTTGETVQALARNAYTLGYLPLSSALEGGLHVLALDRVFPDASGIREKAYPLVTTFYLVRPRDPQDLALRFLSFLKTGPAKDTMRDSGVFPADTPY